MHKLLRASGPKLPITFIAMAVAWTTAYILRPLVLGQVIVAWVIAVISVGLVVLLDEAALISLSDAVDVDENKTIRTRHG